VEQKIVVHYLGSGDEIKFRMFCGEQLSFDVSDGVVRIIDGEKLLSAYSARCWMSARRISGDPKKNA